MTNDPGELSELRRRLLALVEDHASQLSESALTGLRVWLQETGYTQFLPDMEQLLNTGDWRLIEDSFYMHIMIGTGGIRGPLGVGPNRMNLRTIGEAAQGLCNFIEDYGAAAKKAGVIVGHEARRESRAFAELSCEVFAANGIRSYLFDGLRSTPEISFAVRHLGATAGVQITASHNPRTDNGFKFYWADGGQVVPPLDAKFMQLVTEVEEIHRTPLQEAEAQGLVTAVGSKVDDAYLTAVRSLSLSTSRSANIVFSPIHGAGSTNVVPVLRGEGFNVTIVPEQEAPDESFPTAPGDLINPEYNEVMEYPVRLAEEIGADIAICSDPDADRVGVAAKINQGSSKVRILTGNQVGAALTHFVLSQRRDQGNLPRNGLVLETLVTTNLISDIARDFKIQAQDDLLVGFKFIAKIIEELDDPADFIFAAEESLGYLAGDFVRDKDASIAALLICDMVSWLKDQGKTLPAYLDELYAQYGYYKNAQYLVELPGRAGRDIMTAVMLHLRQQPPSALGGLPVVRVNDLLDPAKRARDAYQIGGSTDIIAFELSDDARSRVTVRPSGTEPKLKTYLQHYSPASKDLASVRERIDAAVLKIGNALLDHCYAGLPPNLQEEWKRSTQKII